jgi:predicted nuclease of predicted toxin-antitoxin system
MRILLDENFPIQLYRRLQETGHAAEHIIALGLRGITDDQIRQRLAVEADLLFLTQDTEFATFRPRPPPLS